ncbi:hypothetical protein PGT21_013538 [Puccinia graminis f. sp. tritici]|uniref:Uncharacterized protein n=1 Tax=Puccinia graminis f. sp. tritici TaxID=56615 RepID=A0A5B0QN15_PUCGR|nr:hypothetical protein PGT21_013538 [Puccinia graminis f. sp. tritici]
MIWNLQGISQASGYQSKLLEESKLEKIFAHICRNSTHASDSIKRSRKESVSTNSNNYETSHTDDKGDTSLGQPKENISHNGSIKDTHGPSSTILNRITAPPLATRISHLNDDHRSSSSSP